VVARNEGGRLVVHTLAGTWTLPSPAGIPPAPRQAAVFRYELDPAGRATDVRWEPQAAGLRFVGKMSEVPAGPGTFNVVDVWGNLLGVIPFLLGPGVAPPAGVKPGDLVELEYTFDEAGSPVATVVTQRVLSPVYFGRLDRIGEADLSMTTLQRQRREVRLRPDTFIPSPVQVGDMADVIWEDDPGGGTPFARAIVKE
jgi:hypothetical protein